MSFKEKKIFFCDFCKREIDTENYRIFQAHTINLCRLVAVDSKNELENFDICIDCAKILYEHGLSTVNGINPYKRTVHGFKYINENEVEYEQKETNNH